MADLLVVVELEAVPGITKGIRPGLFLRHNKLLMYRQEKKATNRFFLNSSAVRITSAWFVHTWNRDHVIT